MTLIIYLTIEKHQYVHALFNRCKRKAVLLSESKSATEAGGIQYQGKNSSHCCPLLDNGGNG